MDKYNKLYIFDQKMINEIPRTYSYIYNSKNGKLFISKIPDTRETTILTEKEFLELICQCDKLHMYFEDIKPIEFLENYPNLYDVDLIYGTYYYTLDYDKIKKVYEENKNIKDKLHIVLEGNDRNVTIDEAFQAVTKIKNIADRIKKYNFSPIEAAMYVYDIVRDKPYKQEDINDDYSRSRNLVEVLKDDNDYMVCAGYSNLMIAILKELGVNAKPINLDSTEESFSAHRRVGIYITDPKYDIDNVMYFDPTWDLDKKDENGNVVTKYINRYNYFGKSFSYFKEISKKFDNIQTNEDMEKAKMYEEDEYPDLCRNDIRNLKVYIDKEDTTELEYLLEQFDKLYKLFDKYLPIEFQIQCNLEHPSTEILKGYQEEMLEMFNKLDFTLHKDTLLKIVNNVRKVEYCEDPNKYPYSIENMREIMNNAHCSFENQYPKAKEEYLLSLEGKTFKIKSDDECFNELIFNEGIDKDIKQAHLIKKRK